MTLLTLKPEKQIDTCLIWGDSRAEFAQTPFEDLDNYYLSKHCVIVIGSLEDISEVIKYFPTPPKKIKVIQTSRFELYAVIFGKGSSKIDKKFSYSESYEVKEAVVDIVNRETRAGGLIKLIGSAAKKLSWQFVAKKRFTTEDGK